eukprot:TRINITY_DN34548_c0_g1_i1.p1 TRINITY_DN34548_c0_g1~~TRINITY_DN34548_c0_g1_i1.p1  ORF type:complete len:239 (-),score=50.14 TRINITY_DN34548_c0_g1_i1:51-719(-)
MCIRDRYQRRVRGCSFPLMAAELSSNVLVICRSPHAAEEQLAADEAQRVLAAHTSQPAEAFAREQSTHKGLCVLRVPPGLCVVSMIESLLDSGCSLGYCERLLPVQYSAELAYLPCCLHATHSMFAQPVKVAVLSLTRGDDRHGASERAGALLPREGVQRAVDAALPAHCTVDLTQPEAIIAVMQWRGAQERVQAGGSGLPGGLCKLRPKVKLRKVGQGRKG